MFFHVTGAFAEVERGMIRSRVNAGLDRARARGVRLGRPKVTGKVEDAIRARLGTGEGILKVAKVLGVGTGTVQRVKAEMSATGLDGTGGCGGNATVVRIIQGPASGVGTNAVA
jgi:DNA invertase Pin-like site-specific DNA recombinase